MHEFDQDHERELRQLFADAEAPNTLDAQRIIARSRTRRLPIQLAGGAIGALAVVGIAVLVVQPSLLSPAGGVSAVSEQADSAPAEPAPQTLAQKRAPADRINLCTAPISDVSPSFYGLQLDVEFPATAAAGSESVEGVVRLTNTGADRVTGYTSAAPAITLSQNGIVLWHSNGAMVMSAVLVDLAPGESLQYPASFTPASCTVDDDMAEAFPADLTPVPAGEYELSALVDFNADASMVQQATPELDLVSGPRSTITLQ